MEHIKNNLNSKLLFSGFAILFVLVLFPTNLKALGILAAAILIFINWFNGDRTFTKRIFIVFSVFFLLLALTFFYSSNQAYALRKLTTMSSLLVFPLLFGLIPDNQIRDIYNKRHIFFWIFICSVFLMNAGPFVWYRCTLYGWENMVEHFPTLLTTNLGKWSVHPIYASIHISIAILFSFFLWLDKPSKVQLVILVILNIVLVSFLLLYSKKGPLFALAVVFSLFIIFQRQKRFFVPSLLILISLITLVVLIPTTRERFSELMVIENVKNGNKTSTNIRYSIYDVTLGLVQKEKLLGYGIGDYNDKLREQFILEENSTLVGKKYNTHNQYLSLLLSGGIFLLVAFFIALGMNFVFAIRFDNQPLILLLVLYSIIMLTENILERESGVIYFAFLICFFGLFNKEPLKTN